MIEVVSIKVAGKGLKKPIDIERPGKKAKGSKPSQARPDRPDAEVESATPAPAAMQNTVGTHPEAVASSQQPFDPTRDAAFKRGIGVLRATTKPRKG